MSFSSPLFLALFFPLVWAVHWLGPRNARYQNGVLLFASYAFFYSWGPTALVLFLATTGINYGLLCALRRRGADGQPRFGGLVMWLGIAGNLGQLLFLKYLDFFTGSAQALARLLGTETALPVLSLLVPIGLSFWTLQLIAYLVDVAYGRRPPPDSALDYAVFVAFFPQIIAGPIARGDLLDQLQAARRADADQWARGAFEFLLGYVLCFLVGATLASVVDPVHAEPGAFDLASHWLALYAYTNQIFCDFAGYSLMALGLGRLFGLRLIENFRFPFLARNISDFWKRWHVSLTTFLFDYIYTPLVTGSGWMRGRLGPGLFVVLLLSGLWHGATWMFVLWGGLHGLVLMLAHRWDEFYRSLCRNDRAWVARRKSPTYMAAAWVLTQGWFMLSLIPFRAPDLDAAARFVSGLIGNAGPQSLAFGGIAEQLNLAVCLLLVPVYHLSATTAARDWVQRLVRMPAALRGAAYGTAVTYLFIMQPLADGTFVYANF